MSVRILDTKTEHYWNAIQMLWAHSALIRLRWPEHDNCGVKREFGVDDGAALIRGCEPLPKAKGPA